MRLSVTAAAATVALALGCRPDRIDVDDPEAENARPSADFGLDAVNAAVKAMIESPGRPEDFLAFTRAVDAARPRFNESVTMSAERSIVFLALRAIDSVSTLPPEQQAEKLALTVWPAAFEFSAEPKETWSRFLEHLCGRPLATDCKHVVPEAWPEVLGALAIEKLHDRAKDAFRGCKPCASDATYTAALARYAELEQAYRPRAERARELGDPDEWPWAAESPRPFSGAPVLAIARDGRTMFAGEPVDDWRAALREPAQVLAIHLHPSTQVRRLKEIVRAARAARVGELAIVVRDSAFPYPRKEYRVLAAGKGQGVRVTIRDEDSLGVLIQRFGVAASAPDAVFAL